MRTAQEGHIQGYNGQIAVSQDQIILTAELTQEQNDKKQMIPMMEQTMENIEPLLSPENPDVGPFLFDAGYSSEENFANLNPEHPEPRFPENAIPTPKISCKH
jgi:hypothetical protein